MMFVDSCGWLGWFTDGKLVDLYHEFLADPDQPLVPSIILYDVCKVKS